MSRTKDTVTDEGVDDGVDDFECVQAWLTADPEYVVWLDLLMKDTYEISSENKR